MWQDDDSEAVNLLAHTSKIVIPAQAGIQDAALISIKTIS
jgi:hypothetical protein